MGDFLLTPGSAFATGSVGAPATASLLVQGNLNKDFHTLEVMTMFMTQSANYVSGAADTFNVDYDQLALTGSNIASGSAGQFQRLRQAEIYMVLYYNDFQESLARSEKGGFVTSTGFNESLNSLMSPKMVKNTIVSQWKKKADQILMTEKIQKIFEVSGSIPAMTTGGVVVVGKKKARDSTKFYPWT